LQHNQPLHNKIQALALQSGRLIPYGHDDLAFRMQFGCIKLIEQRIFVNPLKQSRAELSMHLNGAANNPFT
ncbi:hypothetical protein MNBD_PLANCTO03-1620, partial [hydrothermal vent metagenome]